MDSFNTNKQSDQDFEEVGDAESREIRPSVCVVRNTNDFFCDNNYIKSKQEKELD